jgi:hypothetical protein
MSGVQTNPLEFPEISGEMKLMMVLAEAYLSTVSRKRGEAFLRSAATILTREAALSEIVPIRGPRGTPDATLHALAAFRLAMPTLLAMLPPE